MTKNPFENDRPKVIVTRRLPESVENRMRELFDVVLNPLDVAFSEDQMIAALKNADVLVPTVTDKLPAAVLERAGSQLKLIANFGAGVDHIDLAAAQAKGLVVTNTPSVLTEDTADIAMGLIIAAPRRLAEAAAIVRRDEWSGWTPTFMLGRRVNGKKLGFVGFGRIGQAIARRALGFGMSIHYYKRKRLPEESEASLQAQFWDDLDTMLEAVDIVSINCPYTPHTHHLIDAERLRKIGPEGFLINTARGAIVDEEALVLALQNGVIAGAGLDVYEREPHMSARLRRLENVVLLPHISSATIEGRTQMGEKVLVNIKSYADGHTPPDRVLLDSQ